MAMNRHSLVPSTKPHDAWSSSSGHLMIASPPPIRRYPSRSRFSCHNASSGRGRCPFMSGDGTTGGVVIDVVS